MAVQSSVRRPLPLRHDDRHQPQRPQPVRQCLSGQNHQGSVASFTQEELCAVYIVGMDSCQHKLLVTFPQVPFAIGYSVQPMFLLFSHINVSPCLCVTDGNVLPSSPSALSLSSLPPPPPLPPHPFPPGVAVGISQPELHPGRSREGY